MTLANGATPRDEIAPAAGSGRLGPAEHLRALLARLRHLATDASHAAEARRVAGSAFLIRILGALIAYGSQIFLALWMGASEFGIYVYVTVWLLLLGGFSSLGLSIAPQKFIPEYRTTGQPELLRGFLSGSRWIGFGIGLALALLASGAVYLFSASLNPATIVPLYIACLCLPIVTIGEIADGIARSFNWIRLAIAPLLILRPLMMFGAIGVMHVLGYAPTAVAAMLAILVATVLALGGQNLILNRRLKREVEPGAAQWRPREWMATALPIFMVDGFVLLIAYTDVIIIERLRGPEDVASYYAATKLLALVMFVAYSVAAATAHRFAEYNVAGDKARLETFLAQAIGWTFWPSLALTLLLLVFGKFLLGLFGPSFVSAYPVMAVFAIGIMARATIGPVERLLNVVGEQKICAAIFAATFVLNLVLCLALVPGHGPMGAAIASAVALVFESVALFVATKRRLGLHVFFLRGRSV